MTSPRDHVEQRPLPRRLDEMIALPKRNVVVAEDKAFADDFHRAAGGGKNQDGSANFPYTVYTAAMDELWALLAEMQLIAEPFDYNDWFDTRGRDLEAGRGVDKADNDDLSRLVLVYSRGERFCDGFWAGHIRDGMFLRVLERARELGIGGA